MFSLPCIYFQTNGHECHQASMIEQVHQRHLHYSALILFLFACVRFILLRLCDFTQENTT